MIEDTVEGAPGSVLAQLQRAAIAQQESKVLDLPVGGAFGDLLSIRYKPLEPSQMDRYIAKRSRVLERGGNISDLSVTESACDLMAQACVAVLGGGEVLEWESAPVRLDSRLALLLEIPFPEGYEPTAREVILKIFGNNAMAVDSHSTELLTWMQQGTPEVQRLGEA